MISLKVTPVVGLPQFTGWSQVAESTSSASSRLISVFAVSGKHAGNVGRDISDKISDFYYYDIEQLHEFIKELVKISKENDCKLFISCALINKNESIFVTKGGTVFLKRKEKAGKILSSDDQIKIVKGSHTDDDIFVLTTAQASQFLNEIEQKFLQGFDVDIIITSVVPGLHAQSDSSLSAIVFINQILPKKKNLNIGNITKAEKKLSDERKIEKNKIKTIINSMDSINNVNSLNDDVVLDDDNTLNDNNILDGNSLPGSNSSLTVEIDKESRSNDLGADKKLEIAVSFSKSKINIKKLMNNLLKIKSWLKILFVTSAIFAKNIFSWLVKFFKKIFLFIKKIKIKDIFKKKTPNLGVSLDSNFNKKNIVKIVFIVIAILISIGFVSFIFFKNKQEKQNIESLLQPIEIQVATAKEQLNSDPISSRNITLKAIESLKKIREDNKESRYINLISSQLTKTSSFYDSISGKKELDKLDIFYDLRLIKSDYIANNLYIKNDNLILLDSEKKQLVNLNISSKKANVRDFSEYDNVRDITANNDTVFILANGIQAFNFSDNLDNKNIKEIRTLGDSNRNAVFISAYDHFIYVLNPEKHNIYRYANDKDNYSEPIGWMKSATGLKYNEITSFSVDGDIWLSTIDGQIKKFTKGREEKFNLRGLSEPFSSSIKVFTDSELENIYVLEADKNRIVIFNKFGEFKEEIKSSSLATVSSIAVSEKFKKIFAVSGSLVFGINL